MLKRFFIICSGSDTQILEHCSQGEQNKYAGIGATVFFTALMAFIAGSYALYNVFDNLFTSIIFGFIWGLLIFNLDRYIVSTIKKTGNVLDELIQASPRIVLAVIIAIVISKPLELKIFEKEIDHVLLTEKNDMTLANKGQIEEQFSPNITALKGDIATLQNEINSKENEVNALYDTYIAEAEGREGTKLLGKGPVYKEKRDKHDAALAELQQLKTDNKTKITALENQIAQLQGDLENQITKTQPIINNFDGLMARVNALGKLPWLPSFFIFLLFLAIETAPILAKLLAPKGEFDIHLDNKEQELLAWTSQQTHQRKAHTEADYAINDAVYKSLADDEKLYNTKRKLAQDLIELQAKAFYDNQRKLI